MAEEIVTIIRTGIDADTQESSYMNGTLQGVGNNIAMTIHTYMSVPDALAEQGEDAVAMWVDAKLRLAHKACPALTFEVEIGDGNFGEGV